MTYEDWAVTTSAKIQGSWNLHDSLPMDLDFFILLASASGIVGNPGQANYTAGCVYQDQLAHFRRRQGLAATSIDLGAVADVGYLAENTDQYQGQAHLEAMQIEEHELYALLTAAITGRSKDQRECPVQISTGVPMGKVLLKLLEQFDWGLDAKLSILRRMDGGKETLKDDDKTRTNLMEAATALEAAAIIEDALVSRLAKALAISLEDINVARPMHSYGVDSLVAVEVRNWLIRELQAEISVFDILGTMPISALSVKIVETSKLLSQKFEAGEQKSDAVSAPPKGDAAQDAEIEIVEPVKVVEENVINDPETGSDIPDLLVNIDVRVLKGEIIHVVEERDGSESNGTLELDVKLDGNQLESLGQVVERIPNGHAIS
jgi:hypothetical protein